MTTTEAVTFTARRHGVPATAPMAVHQLSADTLALSNALPWVKGDEVLIGLGPFLTLTVGTYVARTARGHKVQVEGYPNPHLVTYVLPNRSEFRA